jgi:uncharacterized protein YjbI with pentapeptide repeats
MKIKITRAQLVAHDVCQEVLSWYDRHAPSGVWEADWTKDLQAALLRERGEFVTWAAHEGLLPRLSMQGADLTGADLTGANLWRAPLGRANLTGANLSGAYLSCADLRCAYLRGANLTGADLIGADLTGADLTGADFTGADLGRANLVRANLKGAMRYPSDPPIRGWRSAEGVLVRE